MAIVMHSMVLNIQTVHNIRKLSLRFPYLYAIVFYFPLVTDPTLVKTWCLQRFLCDGYVTLMPLYIQPRLNDEEHTDRDVSYVCSIGSLVSCKTAGLASILSATSMSVPLLLITRLCP